MSLPVRICHYPRRDGKLPEGAKWVGRPSVFGNVFTIKEAMDEYWAGTVEEAREWCVDWFRSLMFDPDHWASPLHPYRARLLSRLPELRTATALACACPLDQPCHADVLIDLLTADQLEGK